MLIDYNTGDPSERGIYACRVEGDYRNLLKDIFLIWLDGKWGYLGSDQNFRAKVYGWIGPLKRTKMTD